MSREGLPKSITLIPDMSFHRDNIRGVMEVACCICNKIHEKKPSRMIKNKNQYCSPECFYKRTYKENTVECFCCKKSLVFKVKKQFENYLCTKCYRTEYYKIHRERYKKEYVKRVRVTTKDGNISREGYKRLTRRDSPYSKRNGFIFEHTLVMCEFLKRPLFKGETVHHKNGDRLDNRIENLELWNSSQPSGQRMEDKISFYKKFLEQYGYKVLEPIP